MRDPFIFWQRWLFVVSLIIVGFGLVLAFFNQTVPFDLLFNNQINPSFWAGGQIPSDAAAFQRWIYGVLGATVAGWGVMIAFVARYPFRQRQRWAWNCILAAMLIWFVPDTFLSLLYAPFNVAINAVLLAAVLIPLMFTRRDMAGTREELGRLDSPAG